MSEGMEPTLPGSIRVRLNRPDNTHTVHACLNLSNFGLGTGLQWHQVIPMQWGSFYLKYNSSYDRLELRSGENLIAWIDLEGNVHLTGEITTPGTAVSSFGEGGVLIGGEGSTEVPSIFGEGGVLIGGEGSTEIPGMFGEGGVLIGGEGSTEFPPVFGEGGVLIGGEGIVGEEEEEENNKKYLYNESEGEDDWDGGYTDEGTYGIVRYHKRADHLEIELDTEDDTQEGTFAMTPSQDITDWHYLMIDWEPYNFGTGGWIRFGLLPEQNSEPQQDAVAMYEEIPDSENPRKTSEIFISSIEGTDLHPFYNATHTETYDWTEIRMYRMWLEKVEFEMLYDEGTEVVDWEVGYDDGELSLTKTDDYLSISGEADGPVAAWVTSQTVNFDGWDWLVMRASLSSKTYHSQHMCAGETQDADPSVATNWEVHVEPSGPDLDEYTTVRIDISHLSGSYYVAFGHEADDDDKDEESRLYQAWLENKLVEE